MKFFVTQANSAFFLLFFNISWSANSPAGSRVFFCNFIHFLGSFWYKGPLSYKFVIKIYFLIFKTKTYVVGTQKNRLNETVLLSSQNMSKQWIRKYLQCFFLKMFVYLRMYNRTNPQSTANIFHFLPVNYQKHFGGENEFWYESISGNYGQMKNDTEKADFLAAGSPKSIRIRCYTRVTYPYKHIITLA